jgi:hypothetical protein
MVFASGVQVRNTQLEMNGFDANIVMDEAELVMARSSSLIIVVGSFNGKRLSQSSDTLVMDRRRSLSVERGADQKHLRQLAIESSNRVRYFAVLFQVSGRFS